LPRQSRHAELQPSGKGSTGHLGFELFKRLAASTSPALVIAAIRRWCRISPRPDHLGFCVRNQALAQVQTGAIRIIGTINDGAPNIS